MLGRFVGGLLDILLEQGFHLLQRQAEVELFFQQLQQRHHLQARQADLLRLFQLFEQLANQGCGLVVAFAVSPLTTGVPGERRARVRR